MTLGEYLRDESKPLVMRMNELAQHGPKGDFLDLWDIIQGLVRQRNGKLSNQEMAVLDKLQKMARYRKMMDRIESSM